MATLTDTIERTGVATTRRTLRTAIACAFTAEIHRSGIGPRITACGAAFQIVGTTTCDFLTALIGTAAERLT
jgi:hypothetical protein